MAQNKIYVSNMPFSVTENDLQATFAEYGDIDNINIITDRFTGRSRGFAFITFEKQYCAESALKANGAEINGRKVSVSMAKVKETRRPSRGQRR